MGCETRILLTGKSGQVGFELQRALAPLAEIIAVGHAECDLADPDAIRRWVDRVRPSIIVNAAAFTAVDKAESAPALALAVNGAAPGILGEEAVRCDALVVHYSTDYVFDGRKVGPYDEADFPDPLSVYGRSKLAGEQSLLSSRARCLIFRTSWVFGAHGGNFVKTILRLSAARENLEVVADQFGAPTSAALIADVTAQILGQYLRQRFTARDDFPYGLYHLAAAGETTWHAYAQEILRLAKAQGRALKLGPEDVKPITTAEYSSPARRPANSRLDTRKLRETFGLCLPDWRQGLRHVMMQLL